MKKKELQNENEVNGNGVLAACYLLCCSAVSRLKQLPFINILLGGFFVFLLYFNLSATPSQLLSNPTLQIAPITPETTSHQNLVVHPHTIDRISYISGFLAGWLVGWFGLFFILTVKGDLSKRD